ncbi:MAG: lmo0937 family membrane protein [Armatimonadota bacterium]|nr:lmo0937 family membrane protein [Armatimonadota bacterium]
MLYGLAVILVIAWVLGLVAFHISAWFIHLLLVAAIIAVVFNLMSGRGARV